MLVVWSPSMGPMTATDERLSASSGSVPPSFFSSVALWLTPLRASSSA